MLFVVLAGLVLVLAIVDLLQTKSTIRRNYPVIGRLRYLLEKVGPELRQYIVTGNNDERPFSRDQRRWVYSSAKKQNKYFGFGSDNKMVAPQYVLIRHSAFPRSETSGSETGVEHTLPAGKVMGEWRNREAMFRPDSLVNISAMSFGSLSGVAIESLNRGASLAGCLHNTGEGGISKHHLHGGDLIFQLGTGYFGARNSDGSFNLDLAIEAVTSAPVRAIEIKLSQGAKPGLGGMLPGSKVTAEIARARGVPLGVSVASPAAHSAFDSVRSLVEFVELVASACKVPVGIKSAVGERRFWQELAAEMSASGRGPDFIAIDGGEGGTGAAPLVFSDHVSLPFRSAMSEVFSIFAQHGMQEKVLWIGAGKLGFPGEALTAIALGADLIYVAREAMMSIGCIQAQRCHTGHCPTGVATHSKWLTRGLDPTDKSARAANYVISLRHELIQLSHACGVAHPTELHGNSIDLLLGGERRVGLWDYYGYETDWFTGRLAVDTF